MAVTDIKLVFFHFFHIRSLKKQSFSLLTNSHILNWGLQKNANGLISNLGDLPREPLTRDELNISLDKVVLSCNNFGSYYLHGQTGRLKETLNKGSL